MSGFDVDAATVARLGSICLALPEAFEETAWRGTRWRIRQRTFAHVLPLTDGNPASYAHASGIDGPAIILTFAITAAERDLFTQLGLPYWAVRWGRDVGGLVLSDDSDWAEITELVTDSYCLLAPRKLAEQVSISAPDRSLAE